MKRILITGGSGFLGGHLLNQAKNKFQVVATYFNRKCRINGIDWKFCDLTKIDTIELFIERIKPQAIIHTAALTNIDNCESQNESAYLINFRATEKLAVISQKNNIRLIFVSSDMVYDGETGNYSEENKVNPINFYGKTKVMAENAIKEKCANFVIARTALIYGTSLTQSLSFTDKMLCSINHKQTLNLFYDQYRTPILVDNLAGALLELCENQFIGILNLGGSQRINRYNFGMKMADIFNFSTKFINRSSMADFTTTAMRPRDLSLNISKTQNLLSTKFLGCKEGLILSSAKSGKLLTPNPNEPEQKS